MKVAGYIRVSGRGQIHKDGPDRQREAIKAFCDSLGLEFAVELFEKGVSGRTEGMDRPAFRRFIDQFDEESEKGMTPIGVIVVERLDRLARELKVQEIMLSECRKRGIKVFSCDLGQLTDQATDDCDPTRVLIRQVLGAVSQWQKTELVYKLRAARDRIRERTGRCEGKDPYGRNAMEKAVISQIVALRDTMTFERIAIFLNESGARTPQGHEWDRRTVHRIYSLNKPKETQCEEHSHSS
jgi:DNA invertase Pin-like site-specific DNA recombinase